MKMDLITFDLDGTLVDTASEIAEAANRTLLDHGLPQQDPADIALLIGAGTRELMIKLLARLFMQDPALSANRSIDAIMVRFDHHYAETTGTTGVVYEGAHDTLIRLRQAGIKLACVTNKEHRHAQRLMQVTGLDALVDVLMGGDTLPHKKPHPSVLKHVAQNLLGRESAHCAHVGDSRIDVQAARASGFLAWAVPYGYNAGEPISASQPHRIFERLPDVADHVLNPPSPRSSA